ncbi:MAG: SBBP repeat-containing protein, partial [Verrucomicrobia bacterium]|nr:SBBP repeat-containing protein [Verrucomicrobiota bacterium]
MIRGVAKTWGTSYNGSGDAFVTEINPTGSSLIYSTFLGGNGTEDLLFLPPYQPHPNSRIALDTVGNIYITGSTYSSDFPTT